MGVLTLYGLKSCTEVIILLFFGKKTLKQSLYINCPPEYISDTPLGDMSRLCGGWDVTLYWLEVMHSRVADPDPVLTSRFVSKMPKQKLEPAKNFNIHWKKRFKCSISSATFYINLGGIWVRFFPEECIEIRVDYFKRALLWPNYDVKTNLLVYI